MISALAARCDSAEGRVLSFEPHPDALRRLRRLIEPSALDDRIETLPCALSEAEGTMTLSVITEHTGMGTPVGDAARAAWPRVGQARRVGGDGDRLLAGRGRVAGMKIDVEGFESHVIAGLVETPRRDRRWLVAEVIEDHPRRAGTLSAALLEQLVGLGCEAHAIALRRLGLRHGLRLTRLGPQHLPVRGDVRFLPAGSPLRAAVLGEEH